MLFLKTTEGVLHTPYSAENTVFWRQPWTYPPSPRITLFLAKFWNKFYSSDKLTPMSTTTYPDYHPSDGWNPSLLLLLDVNGHLTKERLSSCWLPAVLTSWIMHKLVKRRDRLRSDEPPILSARWASLFGLFLFIHPEALMWLLSRSQALLAAKTGVFCSF